MNNNQQYIMETENSFIVHSWMFRDLELSANEVCIFALIYSFSKDGKSKFYGSLSYLENSFNLSRPTVINILKNLLEKKLIIKEKTEINVFYYCDLEYINQLRNLTSKNSLLVKNFNQGSKKILLEVVKNFNQGSKKILPNNNIYNNNDNNIDNIGSVKNFEEKNSENSVFSENQKNENYENEIIYDKLKSKLTKSLRINSDISKDMCNALTKDMYQTVINKIPDFRNILTNIPERNRRLNTIIGSYDMLDNNNHPLFQTINDWETYTDLMKKFYENLDGSWRPDFDWFLKKENILKVIEKNYNNKKEA